MSTREEHEKGVAAALAATQKEHENPLLPKPSYRSVTHQIKVAQQWWERRDGTDGKWVDMEDKR